MTLLFKKKSFNDKLFPSLQSHDDIFKQFFCYFCAFPNRSFFIEFLTPLSKYLPYHRRRLLISAISCERFY